MIIDIFTSVEDPRVTGRCWYPLSELLMISLLTIMCGGETYVDMSAFAKERADDFGLLQGCNGRRPSPDTFERVMIAIKPESLNRCLLEYGQTFIESLKAKQVAIDGKKLRGSSPKSLGNKGLYLLNAFVTDSRIMLSQSQVNDKENEITAIPGLLDQLEIEGAVVSIDAMGTQTKIIDKIEENNAHFLLGVKGNQPSLMEGIEEAFRHNPGAATASELNADHGRIETRRCRILPAATLEDIDVRAKWPSIKTLVEIKSTVDHGDKVIESIRYYISDEDHATPEYYNMLVRGHWAIENGLHWTLDVIFKEDASRVRKGYAAQNLSIVRKLAMQILRSHNDKLSLRTRKFKVAISGDYLTQVLKNAKLK